MCIADPHRVGHERTYYPGCVNFRAADVIIINKANTAEPARLSPGTVTQACVSRVPFGQSWQNAKQP